MQLKKINSFKDFCKIFNICDILNKNRFIESITHPSFSKKINYERMEFLGDTILNFCISKMVFTIFSNKDEGFLSKKKSFLCSRKVCQEIAHDIKLDKEIILSKKSNINIDTISGNVFESFLCCVYYEYGMEKVEQIVITLFQKYLNENSFDDAKMVLQEFMQKKYKILPKYAILSKEGSENEPIFKVSVECCGKIAEGIGKNKKIAEKNAAANMLNILHFNNN